MRAELIAERGRALSPLEEEIRRVEQSIIDLERKIEEENGALVRASRAGQGSSIAALSISIHECHKKIEGLFEELEVLSTTHAARMQDFEARFEELEERRRLAEPENARFTASFRRRG